ncbi:MAG: hypothetical protein IJA85_03060 [Clostridia bacterium]|nr:hypothetical protein [Clostridia bacterium]
MRQPPDIDFTGQRPPFQGVLCPETNQYTPQNQNFCGWAVANEIFATAPFAASFIYQQIFNL